MCKHTELSEVQPFVPATEDRVASPASRTTANAASSSSFHSPAGNDHDQEVNNMARRTPMQEAAVTTAVRRTGILALLSCCLFAAFFSLGTQLKTGVGGDARGDRTSFRKTLLNTEFSFSVVEEETEDDDIIYGMPSEASASSTMLRKSLHDGRHGRDYARHETHKVDIERTHHENNEMMLSGADRALLSFLHASSFGRETVIDFLLNEYTSPESPDTVMKKRLKNAIDVLETIEADGEPVGIKGHPFLFVGSVGAAMNHKSLHEHGITHIINWSSTTKCNVYPDIQYLCFPGIRDSDQMLDHTSDLEKAVEFAESARKVGGKVMSQCWYGRNRSVTLLVAYLMKYEGMSTRDAHHLVRETRPQADPYRDVLKKYARQYLIAPGERMMKTAKKKQKKTMKGNENH